MKKLADPSVYASDVCCVEGCSQQRTRSGARGYCAKHYYRFMKYGTTDESALHHVWGKGSYRDRHGYVLRKQDGKYRPEHHLVMEQKIGRRLYPEERVHHMNGIRHDNRPENLELWLKGHPSGQRVSDIISWVVDHYPDEVEEYVRKRIL